MTTRALIALAALWLSLAPPGGAARAESAARLLAMDAGMSFALALREEDPKRRSLLLDEAQGKIDRVLSAFPDSPEAQKLRADGKLAGVSTSILAAARRAVRAELEQGGELPPGERDRCLTRPTMSCLFDLAAVTARRHESPAGRSALIAQIAEARARGGELEKALSLVRPLAYGRPKGPGTRAVTEIAALQAVAGPLDLALVTARNLDSRAARGRALARITEALAADGQMDAADKVAQSIGHQASRLRAEVAIALAGPPSEESLAVVDEGIERAHRLPGRLESDAALEAIAEALVEAGDLERAQTAIRLIIDQVPRQRVGSRLALHLAATVAIEPAIEIAREIGGAAGEAALLVRLAKARLEARDMASVAAVLQRLEAPTARGQVLDGIASQRLSAPQAKQLAEAAAQIEDPGERARGLAIAGRSLAALGASGEAEALRRDALAPLAELDPWRQAPALLEVAAIDSYLDRDEAALQTLAEIPAGALWYDQAQGLARALAAKGAGGPVLAMAESLSDRGDRERFLLAAALAFAEAGRTPVALSVAEAIETAERRDHALFGIAKAGLAGTADPAAAAAIFEQAASLQQDDNLLQEFAAAQSAAGDLLGALRTAEQIESPSPKARVYVDLAEKLRNPLASQ